MFELQFLDEQRRLTASHWLNGALLSPRSFEEGLSRIYTFTLSIIPPSDSVANESQRLAKFYPTFAADVLNERVVVRWIENGQLLMEVFGVVVACEPSFAERFSCVISVAPKLSVLGNTCYPVVFRNLPVWKIASELLRQVFIAGDVYLDTDLRSQHPNVRQEVAFDEPLLDFFHRITADNGLWYEFEWDQGHQRIILRDANPATRVPLKCQFDGSASDAAVVFYWTRKHLSSPHSLESGSPDLAHPKCEMTFRTSLNETGCITDSLARWKSECRHSESVEEANWVHNIKVEQWGSRLANRIGKSRISQLRAGTVISLDGGPEPGTYLVTSVSHSWPQVDGNLSRYENSFECLPIDIPFRPTPKDKKRIDGVHPALVVSQMDSHHEAEPPRASWGADRSVPIRPSFLASPDFLLAAFSSVGLGSGPAMFSPPRCGDWVWVAFVQGDPSRPVIAGSASSAIHPLPFDPIDAPFDSAWGGGYEGVSDIQPNQVRFRDEENREQFYISAAKAFDLDVAGESRMAFGGDFGSSMAGNRSEYVAGSYVLLLDGDLIIKAKGNISWESEKGITLYSGTAKAELSPQAGVRLSGSDIALDHSTTPLRSVVFSTDLMPQRPAHPDDGTNQHDYA